MAFSAVRAVNSAMVRAYWRIGRAIVESEQRGEDRAAYGEGVIASLAARLTRDYGKGFTATNLKYMRQFHLAFGDRLEGTPSPGSSPEKSHALRDELSWTHYRILLKVDNPQARAFYEAEAADGRWSTRELERQIASSAYERLALSSDKRAALAASRAGAVPYSAGDFVKDPYVLEFLGLPERPSYSEADLEAALITHLQEFLLELGRGFSFVGRQQRLTLDGDHFYVDLVFYNRLLRCFVLIDLKVGRLTHQDIGQMQLYVNYYTREMREEWENPAIGLLLCAGKNDTVVRYTLPEGQQQIFASRYQLSLPSEEELAREIESEREHLNSQRRLEAAPDGEEGAGEEDTVT